MQALKAASQQPQPPLNPSDPPSLGSSPSPPHPQQLTPAKHTPSAAQVAIIALTSDAKAAARQAAVAPDYQQQQLQPQLQGQLPRQLLLSASFGEESIKALCPEPEQGSGPMPAADDGLSEVHRQLSQEFELEESASAESVPEEAETEADSIEVCT